MMNVMISIAGAAMLVLALIGAATSHYDMGPTYGKDYAGLDYNVTLWHSGPDRAANNYEVSAKECEQFCLNDPKCCSWTYCPPGSGTDLVDDLGERCCLKNGVPAEVPAKHWTGLPPRATDPTNTTLSKQCQGPPPGCTSVNGTCDVPYPGENFTHPKIHQSPDCLHLDGWHDMAGALSYKGTHHAFQGCPKSTGWSHSTSTDLVHWTDRGRNIHELHETYEGMDSLVTPCSGFVTVDDDGIPCAGFRQCGSSKGTTGLNPSAHAWDVPMEIRCAENANLTQWSGPIWLYPVYYYRALPYDPVRPWKDFDGKWYSAWSTDGCNATTKAVPCAAGGQLELLTSPSLHGSDMNWVQLAPMFTTNVTKSGAQTNAGAITREFVTSGYFGGIPGDPDGGKTRVITQNNAGATFWVGSQANGSAFEAYWDKPGAVGFYDYGSLTMARTLGSDPNQVAVNGRRVLIGWIGGTPASQSLARDLTLSNEYELLQQFVPELKMLRQPSTHHVLRVPDSDYTTASAADGVTRGRWTIAHTGGSLQLELVVTFAWSGPNPTHRFGVSVLGGAAEIAVDCTTNSPQAPGGCMVGCMSSQGPLMPIGAKNLRIHAIVDHQIIETIFNNRTAMVTYAKPANASAIGVALFGIDTSITAHLETWSLDDANNNGPQP
eukprot:m.1466875 g.1466875  ORF g.1466875 m.1466875 type:complete len:661 (+) comp25138_c0_seq20:3388-5370(+)